MTYILKLILVVVQYCEIKKPALKNIGIDLDSDVIQSWSGYSPENHKFFNNDALTFLTKYLFTGKELVYCDPPYVLSTRRRQKIYKV